ncbi:ArsR/SmtB family transcription factor [Amycolatopsis sp. NPDC059090]|uniref:ArsR/SmtB family transcription factor n=1 Tax=unclassified Amycolatopsis TaxID=2618356 RepID=UPI00366FF35C
MVEIRLSHRGIARTTLAASSPLTETVFSIRTLLSPVSRFPLHQPWTRRVRKIVRDRGVDLTLLTELVRPGQPVPAFLAPPPYTPVMTAELARLRAVPAESVRQELDLHLRFGLPPTPRLAQLRAEPEAGLAELATTVEAYWRLAIEPHWPTLRLALEGDLAHRTRQLAHGGLTTLFANLHSDLSWDEDRTLRWNFPLPLPAATSNTGIQLHPSAFLAITGNTTSQCWPPTMCYPTRCVAALWDRPHPCPDPLTALAKILGRSRALLLSELAGPATTTELALRTRLTTGCVSQHLTALHHAGLVTARRDGLYVLYARTAVSDALLAGGMDQKPT